MGEPITASTAEKTKNYSAEQEAELVSASPVSYEMCCEFADDWDKSPRSVIAKVKQLGIEYIPKAKPSKKVSKGDTKAQLVEKIEKELDSSDYFSGLEKATASALVNLLGVLRIKNAETEADG